MCRSVHGETTVTLADVAADRRPPATRACSYSWDAGSSTVPRFGAERDRHLSWQSRRTRKFFTPTFCSSYLPFRSSSPKPNASVRTLLKRSGRKMAAGSAPYCSNRWISFGSNERSVERSSAS